METPKNSTLESLREKLPTWRNGKAMQSNLTTIQNLSNQASHARPDQEDIDAQGAASGIAAMQSLLSWYGGDWSGLNFRPAENASNLTEAIGQLCGFISRIPCGTEVHLDVLGLSFGTAWKQLQSLIIPELISKKGRVTIDLRMLDPDWRFLGKLKPSWVREARQSLALMRGELPSLRGVPNLQIRACRYRAIPVVHGFRLRNCRVIAALLRFNGDHLVGARTPFYSVSPNSRSAVSKMLADHFESQWIASGLENVLFPVD